MISRRIKVQVLYHHVDMMQIVHNSQYFKWFERGRLALIDEFIPMEFAIKNQVATPVVLNHCEYLQPARFGDLLIVSTKHRLMCHWDGRFVFEHSISNSKTKVEVCFGRTEVTMLDMNGDHLIKKIPEDIWRRYQSIH